MTTKKGLLKQFPQSFWVANTMEIFERMAWYGFFALSSIYITGSVASGGLGFSSEDRGLLQGVVAFFIYLFPFVTGALGDRLRLQEDAAHLLRHPLAGLLVIGTDEELLALLRCLHVGGNRCCDLQALGGRDDWQNHHEQDQLYGLWHLLYDGQYRWFWRALPGGLAANPRLAVCLLCLVDLDCPQYSLAAALL